MVVVVNKVARRRCAKYRKSATRTFSALAVAAPSRSLLSCWPSSEELGFASPKSAWLEMRSARVSAAAVSTEAIPTAGRWAGPVHLFGRGHRQLAMPMPMPSFCLLAALACLLGQCPSGQLGASRAILSWLVPSLPLPPMIPLSLWPRITFLPTSANAHCRRPPRVSSSPRRLPRRPSPRPPSSLSAPVPPTRTAPSSPSRSRPVTAFSSPAGVVRLSRSARR